MSDDPRSAEALMRLVFRKEAAEHQLQKALELFQAGDFVCALTLAGAAEHVLAGLAVKADQGETGPALKALQERTKEPKWAGEMANYDWNQVRNWLKHPAKETDTAMFSIRLAMEAGLMLNRALMNVVLIDETRLPEIDPALRAVQNDLKLMRETFERNRASTILRS